MPYVNEADVEYVVLDEGSKGGLFGRGKMEARVEARLLPTDERVDGELPPGAEVLREFVRTVVELMGIEASVDAAETVDTVSASISGDDLGLLIGRHGATIDALQYIAAIVVNGDRKNRRQVIVDAEGYRERRAVALKSLADRTAQKVVARGREHRAQAHERRRAQGRPPASQGPPARGDDVRGARALPRRRHLSEAPGRLSPAPRVKQEPS